MRLLGIYNSPYVRRVAISLNLMGLPFEHEPTSVFADFDHFGLTNPVVKAPTLVMDDGIVLMESSLILEHLDRFCPATRRLTPGSRSDHARAQRIVALALTACEKAVQIIYETVLRPAEKAYQPLIERFDTQLCAAMQLLNEETARAAPWLIADRPMQADITAAVAWRYAHASMGDVIPAERYPNLAAFSARAEALPEFLATAPPKDMIKRKTI